MSCKIIESELSRYTHRNTIAIMYSLYYNWHIHAKKYMVQEVIECDTVDDNGKIRKSYYDLWKNMEISNAIVEICNTIEDAEIEIEKYYKYELWMFLFFKQFTPNKMNFQPKNIEEKYKDLDYPKTAIEYIKWLKENQIRRMPLN